MRKLTDTELGRIQALTENSVEITLLETTKTGLIKFTLDATAPVRSFLKSQGIHDYALQAQGQQNKVILPAYILTDHSVVDSKASLYRPVSKEGDPRIWFKRLNGLANANDIVGIIVFQNVMYVINITQLDVEQLLKSPIINPLADLVNAIRSVTNAIANELLFLLRKIAGSGPVRAINKGDTSIGATLEHLLGIKMNSSKNPDYKGIELKSYRDERNTRKGLFTQVPNWKLSKLKSSTEILNAFGYHRDGEFRLYCTVSTSVRNSQGLKLRLETGRLYENSIDKLYDDFVFWDLSDLHKALLTKHNETFWIGAESSSQNGDEYFQYKVAEHTKNPIISQFDLLLDQGLITVDHLIKATPSGSGKEKGPAFKLNPSSLNILFPPSHTYDLLST